jgi:hypothetical protein
MDMMLNFFQRRRYKKQVLAHVYALLRLYPLGLDNIVKSYPGILSAIDSNFAEQMPPPCSALFVAASVLTNDLKALTAEQRLLIRNQLPTMPMAQLRAVMAGESPKFPEEITFGVIMYGVSILTARMLVDSGKIEQADYNLFWSEIFGALEGKTADQRSSERISGLLDQRIPLPSSDTSRV